jgi:hypothetical protein
MAEEQTVVIESSQQIVVTEQDDGQVVVSIEPVDAVVVEVGAVGPPGARGVQGIQGVQGVVGPQGPYGGTVEITVTIDGGGAVITPGPLAAYKPVSVSGTLVGWYMVADELGSISIDVWKSHAVVPTAADLISGLNGPVLLNQQVNSVNSLPGWTTAIAVGDIFGFNVAACSGIKRVTLVLVFH